MKQQLKNVSRRQLEFLAHSEAEFETGDTRQGAEKLYGAACQVVMAAAKQRGWAFPLPPGQQEHRDQTVGRVRGPLAILWALRLPRGFYIHFYHGDMEDYEIDAIRPDVSAYVRHMATLIEEYDKAPQHGR